MKISMSRDVTNKVHWILDNILPPIVRECRPLMRVLAFMIYGKYGKYYIRFKENGHFLHMDEAEMRNYYKMITPIIVRETDINHKCLELLEKRIENYISKQEHFQKKRTITILDISCGRGYLCKALAKKYPYVKVVGCDLYIPEEMKAAGCDVMQNMEYVEGNIENIPFQDHYFDIVISAHTLEHVINAEKAIAELRRVCKRKMFIIVPCQREYQYSMDFHVRFFPYTWSLQKLTGNIHAKCKKISNDLFYEEDVT